MANIQSAKKRARQTIVKNELKSSQRASVRTAIKSVEQAIEAKDHEQAKNLFLKPLLTNETPPAKEKNALHVQFSSKAPLIFEPKGFFYL